MGERLVSPCPTASEEHFEAELRTQQLQWSPRDACLLVHDVNRFEGHRTLPGFDRRFRAPRKQRYGQAR